MNAISESGLGIAGRFSHVASSDRAWLFQSAVTRSCLENMPATFATRSFCLPRNTVAASRGHTVLHQLKRELLRAALEHTSSIESYKRICGAANEAASLAWSTSEPLLVFPCLFEELVQELKTEPGPARVAAGHA